MSRGPGQLQRLLLAKLAEGGRWRFVYELAGEVYPGAGYPLAFYTSAMRAARSLARRGLVCLDRIQAGRLGQESFTVAVWLPDQESPYALDPRLGQPQHHGKRLIRAAEVRAAVDQVLTAPPSDDDQDYRLDRWRRRGVRIPAGAIEYGCLVDRVRKRLPLEGYARRHCTPAVCMAVRRCLEGLERVGEVDVIRTTVGRLERIVCVVTGKVPATRRGADQGTAGAG
jgi:hypothetical protein